MQKGNDLIISLKVGNTYKAIAGSNSCDVDAECELIETSSPTSGRSKTYIPGKNGWKISCNYLVKNDHSIVDDLLSVGKTYTIKVSMRLPGATSILNTYCTGVAILTRCRVTGQRGSLMKGLFEFQGSGPLTPETKPAPQL